MNFGGLSNQKEDGNARKLNIVGKTSLETSNQNLLSNYHMEILILPSGEVSEEYL